MAQTQDQDREARKQKELDRIIDNLSADPKPAQSADPKAPIKPPTPEQNAQSVADNIKKTYGGKFKPTHGQMQQELNELKKALEDKKVKQTDPNTPLSKEDQEKNTKIDKSIKKIEDAQAHFKDPKNFEKYQKNEENKENAAKKAKTPEKPTKNRLQKMAEAWGDLGGNLFGAWLKQIGNITLKGLWENIKKIPGKITSPFKEAYEGIKNLFGGGKSSEKSKGSDQKTNPTVPSSSTRAPSTTNPTGSTAPVKPAATNPTGTTTPSATTPTTTTTPSVTSPTGAVPLAGGIPTTTPGAAAQAAQQIAPAGGTGTQAPAQSPLAQQDPSRQTPNPSE